jgi:hypothetical protein
MTQGVIFTADIRATILTAGVALSIGLVPGAAAAVDQIDPKADKILVAMSGYMDGLNAFTVSIDADNEVIDTTGRKLQFSASSSIVVQRPEDLYVERRGRAADMELFYDGEKLTIHEKGRSVYLQSEHRGVIEDAINEVRTKTGFDIPAGDLIYKTPYGGLIDGVVSGDYLGRGFVDGVECHHLAFRQSKVDWQLWVQAGDQPLPMKYVIVNKWVTGAPQYSVRFRDWNTKPVIGADRFVFSPLTGAKKLESITFNEVGGLMLEEDQ